MRREGKVKKIDNAFRVKPNARRLRYRTSSPAEARRLGLDPESATEPAHLAEGANLATCLSAASQDRTAPPLLTDFT